MTDHGQSPSRESHESAGLGVYLSLLRIPHVARSAITGVIGEFPFPFLGMGLLVAIREGYGNYTLAGTVSAVMAITSAFTGPLVGRMIDARGQRTVGLPLSAFWIFSILFMAAALQFHWPAWVILLGAVLLGTSVPYSSMLRARWTYVLQDKPGRLNSALSLTSTLEELMWVIGNPLGTVLATSVAALSPLFAAIVAILVSVWGFLLDRAIEPPASGKTRKALKQARLEAAAKDPAGVKARVKEPLFTAGFVALMTIQIAYGAFLASTNISVLALAKEVGLEGNAGFVIAAFSGASMLGAIGYGARAWSSPLWVRFYVGLTVVAVGSSFLLFSHSLTAAAAILFVAGLAQAPTVVNVNQLLIRMTPDSRFTEAMAMLGAMFVIGMAVSNFVSGAMIDAMGSHGGFTALAGFAGVALVIGVASMRPIRSSTTAHAMHDVNELLSSPIEEAGPKA